MSHGQTAPPGYGFTGAPPPPNNPQQGFGYGAQPGFISQQVAPHQGYSPQQGYPPQHGYSPMTQNAKYQDPRNIRSAERGGQPGEQFAFSDKLVRHAFIRKVCMIIALQMLFTFAFVVPFYTQENLKTFIQQNIWVYIVAVVVYAVTYFAIICCKSVARSFPGNVICLFFFTLAMSYMLAIITSYYAVESVLIALGTTTLVVVALTIFATQTKVDFTMCSAMMFVLSIVLFLSAIACGIFYALGGTSKIPYVLYGCLGTLIFSVFLVYDIQLMVGGRGNELSPEDYVYGALQIYMDVVNLFIHILKLVGAASGD